MAKRKQTIENEKQFIESINNHKIDSTTKSKYRLTTQWKNFRKSFYIIGQKILKNGKKKDIIGIDYLTGSKLTKTFNLHHKGNQSDLYTSLDRNRYIALNNLSHKCIHYIYTQMCKDRTYLDRLTKLINEMGEMNNWTDFGKD